jgi:4-amino-4-deoxy-L-arabinose transferase-like glycosyltransferase
MARKSILILFGVLVIGFLLRIYRITSLPMYGDELTMVYDTYSILKTGKDSTGERLPITFKMGAGRPGGYIYASVPFVYIFGPSELGIRSLSLLSGLGMIVLMYALGKKIFDSEKIGLVASFLTSISMWDIYLSRGGFEAHFALFLAILGVTAFLYKRYIFWAIAWGLAIHTYPTFKLTLPILGVVVFWFNGVRTLLKNKVLIVGLIILLFFGGVAIRETLNGRSEERFLSTNVFADQSIEESVIQRVDYERTASTLPEVVKPIFINRPIEYGRIFLDNYIKNISLDFLFIRGDGNPRHNPGEFGMLYLVDLPLILAGLVFLLREQRRKFCLLTVWILITPLATMFFPEAHALRNDLMLPPLILLSALALVKIPRRFMHLAYLFIMLQLIYILVRIYYIAPVKFASFWSAEAKKVSLQAIANQDKNKTIILSTKIDNIEYAYPVYAKIDPNLVIAQYDKYPKVYGNVIISDK